MQAIYILLLSLFISMVLVPVLEKAAGPLGLTDKPNGRKVHRTPIPRAGGIAITIGAIVPVVLLVPWRRDVLAFVFAVIPLFVFGVLDDRFDLDYRLKLLGQVLAAAILTIGGGIIIQVLPFFDNQIVPSFIAVPFTILVLVAVTNAFNLSDGLDGLAGGLSLLALGCVAMLAYESGHASGVAIALAMIGSTFGFLRFNSNPAQIFMGDTGSQFLGFGTAALLVWVTQSGGSAVGKLIPVLIVGVPILDTLNVIVRRLLAGRSPFSPDRSHLHHQLLLIGWSQYQAVVFIYLIQALMVIAAYMLRFSADYVVLAIYLVVSGSVLWLMRVFSARSADESIRIAGYDCSVSSSQATWSDRLYGWLGRAPKLVLGWLVPAVVIMQAILSTEVGSDIGLVALLLLFAFAASLLSRSSHTDWLERLSAYVVISSVVLLSSFSLQLLVGLDKVFFLFIAIGFVMAVWVKYSAVSFRTTTLDVLILMIACFVPMLSDVWSSEYALLVLQCIILFYAIEILLTERALNVRLDLLRISVLSALTILSVKGLLPVH